MSGGSGAPRRKDATLKRCPYCGSEIKEEAIRCRYCRRDLPVEPVSAPEWSEPSLGYSFSGHRYVLGWTERRFAIWDRGRIAQPAISFPRTPGGWEMAWNRFIGMEPGAVAVGGRASIPELGSRPY